MIARVSILFLFLISAGEAGTETRREVVCRVRCRTNPSDVTLIVRGVKESLYQGGYCGLQMFNFVPTNAKVGVSTKSNDTPASPHYVAVTQQVPNRLAIQFEHERYTYKIGEANIIHASEIPGGPGIDGKPQIIDAQCIWKDLPITKEFLEEFKKFSDMKDKVYPKPEEKPKATVTAILSPLPSLSPSLSSAPIVELPVKTIERDPIVCERMTTLPIRLPISGFAPILARTLRQAPVFDSTKTLQLPEEHVDVTENGLKQSDYVYSDEEKAKILEALPPLDVGICKWGCGNNNTQHALLWNISNIVKGFKQTQELKHAKILKVEILTDNNKERYQSAENDMSLFIGDLHKAYTHVEAAFGSQARKIEKLKRAERDVVMNESDDKSAALLTIPAEDIRYFFEYVFPYVTFKHVPTEQFKPDRVHIDYRYDFD